MRLRLPSLLLVCLVTCAAGVPTACGAGAASAASAPTDAQRAHASELARQAIDLLDHRRYPEAEDRLRAALAIVPDKATWLYNLACIQSVQGKTSAALDSLERATEVGFTDFTFLEHDPTLTPLRALPRYLALLARKDEIRHRAAERAVAQLKAEFGDRYLYEADEQDKLIFAVDSDQTALDSLKQLLLAQAHSQWDQLFAHRPDEFIRIVVPSARDYAKLVKRRGVAGMYIDDTRTLVAQRMGQVMVHEFTHALHAADQRALGQAHPVWLREGLASMYEAGEFEDGVLQPADNYRLGYVQAACKRHALVPLHTLLRYTPEEFVAHANLAYGESSSLLLYLYEKDLLRKFYDNYKAGYSLDPTGQAALEHVTGMELADLQKAWSEWALKRPVPSLQPLPGSASLGVRFTPQNDGLKLSLVFPGGPGALSGLKIGDVIVGMDGREVRDYPTLLAILMNHKAGDLASLKIRRGEQYLTVPVALGKR